MAVSFISGNNQVTQKKTTELPQVTDKLDHIMYLVHLSICGCLTYKLKCLFVCLMVFNTTFNNISVILWWSILLVEETGGPWENHWPVASHWQTLSHNVVHLALIEIRTHNISGDRHCCIGSCKSNYHTIMATTSPQT